MYNINPNQTQKVNKTSYIRVSHHISFQQITKPSRPITNNKNSYLLNAISQSSWYLNYWNAKLLLYFAVHHGIVQIDNSLSMFLQK